MARREIVEEVVSTKHKTPHSFESRGFNNQSILPSRWFNVFRNFYVDDNSNQIFTITIFVRNLLPSDKSHNHDFQEGSRRLHAR